ncbi:MAG: organomercurial lyase [Acidimicrobiia bacterium]
MGTEDVRLAIYQSFRRTGRAPTAGQLAGQLGMSVELITNSLAELATQRHLVLDETGEIVMAHPFSAIPMGFSVMGANALWWGGCSWDSFALPHLITEEPDVLVATRCPGCDRPVAWIVSRESPPATDWVAHFLVPVAQMWDDVVHTCSNQRLFCSEGCLTDWLQAHDYQKGYVMETATLWRLASRWYEGRLDFGYQRREPTEAKDYFRRVGLKGPFWGLAED